MVDAEQPLPFCAEAFDLALIIHYVSDSIIEAICPLVRPGGFLIYESFGAHGNNWTGLPLSGQTAKRLSGFELLELRERDVRGTTERKVTVKMLAQKFCH
ncbi:hypothetical protein MPL1032_220153 [Mesorhizobium plurifarium]|uniref:Methyltransferase type 11 domain-containing protein n=1 Tax=Mesorhizobium plurifarium TaxID=69974 RepID=A0A0K2VZ62_MESPL|nr:hypothetical protein MPL1032_220153 [Mesorhizobium plurifarium]